MSICILADNYLRFMLKKILFSFIVLLGIVLGFIWYMNEPLPTGNEGLEAEELADSMLEALNKPAWDSLKVISWSFPRGHDFVWDKESNEVEVRWDGYKVIVNTQTKEGEVFENEKLVNDGKEKLVNSALSYFYNDSFWLIAPYKVKDPGTIRKLVDYEGRDALLVQYTLGGVTPGDSYLWILDEDFRPVAWKMWVSIIPIGGLKFTWEDWKDANGAQISTFHNGLMNIQITNLTSKN